MQKVSSQPDSDLATGATGRHSLASRLLGSRELSVVAVLLVLGIVMFFSGARTNFYSSQNLIQVILVQTALLGVFAIGETIVIITGGIDLSLGSLIAFSGMLLALLTTTLDQRMYTGAAVAIAIVVTLLVSFGIGALHATLIHRVRLPAFVVTLVSMLVLRSQSSVMRHRQQIPIPKTQYPLYDWLVNGRIFADTPFAIPVSMLVLGTVAVTVVLILARTRMGRYLYSIGNNEQATMLSGVNVFRVKLFAYGASGLLGGLAGILWAGYDAQGSPQAGNGYELQAVAAAVVGGANLAGGQGSVLGTVLGACLLHTINSAILLSGLGDPTLWRDTVVGSVLLLAVLTTALQQRRRRI